MNIENIASSSSGSSGNNDGCDANVNVDTRLQDIGDNDDGNNGDGGDSKTDDNDAIDKNGDEHRLTKKSRTNSESSDATKQGTPSVGTLGTSKRIDNDDSRPRALERRKVPFDVTNMNYEQYLEKYYDILYTQWFRENGDKMVPPPVGTGPNMDFHGMGPGPGPGHMMDFHGGGGYPPMMMDPGMMMMGPGPFQSFPPGMGMGGGGYPGGGYP